MCYPKPGPRCPSQALLLRDKAERKWDNATTVKDREQAMAEIMEARKQYDMTVQGQKQIEQLITGAKAEGSQEDVTNLQNRLESARQARQDALNSIGIKSDAHDASHKHNIPTTKEKPNERTQRLLEMAQVEKNSLATAEGWERHLKTTANFPSMPFNNQLLVEAQNPQATNLRTYEEWRKAGRVVKRNNQATYLLSPTVTKHQQRNPETRKMETVERITGFRSIATYDETETTGKTLSPAHVDREGFNNGLKAKLSTYGYTVSYAIPRKNNPMDSVTMVEQKKVVLRKDISSEDETKALAKELSHIALAHDKTAPQDADEVKTRNLEAYSLAHVIKKKSGLNDAPDFKGFEDWSSNHPSKKYAERVSKAAKFIFA